MNEREFALQVTRNALPALEQIDILYNAAINEDQRFRAITASYKQHRESVGTTLGLTCGFLVFFILTTLSMIIEQTLWMDIDFIACVAVALFLAVICYLIIRQRFESPSRHEDKALDISMLYVQQLSDEIDRIALDNQNVINQLPRDYRCFDAAVYLEYVLANRQADTMKEAMNLYQLMLHQRRMENYQQQLVATSQLQSQMLTDIEHNTALTGQAASAIAFAYIVKAIT